METSNGFELENLAGMLAEQVNKTEDIQDARQAVGLARALAIIELGVADELRLKLEAWTLRNGPVVIDSVGDQAYGQWEKKTTTVSDESGLWEFLKANGKDPEHYKRADRAVIKSLLSGEDVLDGIQGFVGSETSYVFSLKRNLLKQPRGFQKPSGAGAVSATRWGLGPEGVVERARVVKYTPSEVPALIERIVEPSCSVMPPERVSASK